jgi:hypothetical protein
MRLSFVFFVIWLFCASLPAMSQGEAQATQGGSPEPRATLPAPVSSNEYYGSPHLLPLTSTEPIQLPAHQAFDWVIWVILLSLTMLALARFLFPARMQQYFKVILGMRFFNQMERDGTFFNETLNYLLLLNYLAAVALLITLSLFHFLEPGQPLEALHPVAVYLLVFAILGLFYPLKSLLTGFLAWVFKTQGLNSIYQKNLFLYNHLTGILLLPFVAYAAYQGAVLALYMGWGLVAAGVLLKVFRYIFVANRIGGFSGYYIILYLCGVELAPLLVIIKAASNYL